jgi:hypothetical protein
MSPEPRYPRGERSVTLETSLSCIRHTETTLSLGGSFFGNKMEWEVLGKV